MTSSSPRRRITTVTTDDGARVPVAVVHGLSDRAEPLRQRIEREDRRAGERPAHLVVRACLLMAFAIPGLVSAVPPARVVTTSGSPGAAGQQIPLPSDDPESWLLGFVDVETTGLTPGHHEMIDVGLILTDVEGRERARFFERIRPRHPERLAPEAAAINGFSVERWERLGARSGEAVVAELIRFLRAEGDGRRILLVAYNVAFDAAFLEHLFRHVGEELEEHVFFHQLDLPSMAWALGYRQVLHGALPEALGLEPETDDPLRHTGLSGAEFNVALYRRLREEFPSVR